MAGRSCMAANRGVGLSVEMNWVPTIAEYVLLSSTMSPQRPFGSLLSRARGLYGRVCFKQ